MGFMNFHTRQIQYKLTLRPTLFFNEKEAFGGADVALFVIGGKGGVSRDKEDRILRVNVLMI